MHHASSTPCCPYPFCGDAQQLRQVLHNLLQNAQDATEACRQLARPAWSTRGVLIRTQWFEAKSAGAPERAGPGAGLSEENILKRAFEPYVTTKAKGTGLGLAVVKKIADEHGSRIEHQQPPGRRGRW